MILLRDSTAAIENTIAIRSIIEQLGVQSLLELDVDEFRQQKMQSLGNISSDEHDAITLIAPFSCLDSIVKYDTEPALTLPKSIKRVFFHSLETSRDCERFLRNILCDSTVRLVPINSRPIDFIFSKDKRDICGPLTGLTIRTDEETPCWGLDLQSKRSEKVFSIIESNGAGVLLCLREKDVDIFMLFTSHLIDLDQFIDVNIDIRTCLLSFAAPVVMLKYLSRGLGWTAKNNYANLIIDDVPISLRYGYLDFKRVYDLVAKRRLSMALAFIPLNYRRGSDESIRFFKAVAKHISFCIHGCNHTKSEFGGVDGALISTLASLASNRMKTFSERTGLTHAKIMVFPHGIFSARALEVLKRHNFNAAVNTELKDVSGETRVTIKDMLHPAITSGNGLPLFLRRKVSHGIGNVAFDLLLDKPCLLVTHHDDFFSDLAPVWQLVDAINGLPSPPEWRPLDEIVARTVVSRNTGSNLTEVKIFSRIAYIEPLPGVFSQNSLRVVKHESQPEIIDRILVGQGGVEWKVENENLIIDLGKHFDRSLLTVFYRQDEKPALPSIKLSDAVIAWLRRRLCDFRDNHISTSPFLRNLVQFIKKLF